MEIQNKIAVQVKKLDYNWFVEISARFKSDPTYNSNGGTIEAIKVQEADEFVNYEEDKPAIEYIPEKTTTVIVDFLTYCWDYNGHHDNVVKEDYEIPCGKSATDEILSLLDDLFGTNRNIAVLDIVTANNVIEKIISEVSDSVAELAQSRKNDSNYHSVLEDFIARFIDSVSNKYRGIRYLYQLGHEEESKLEFNLSEIAIARLLFILDDYGLLKNIDKKNHYLNFCDRYFYYKKKGEYIKANGLKTAFKKVKGDDNKTGISRSKVDGFREKFLELLK